VGSIMELTLKNIFKAYNKKTVLTDVSQKFTIGVYGILGPNGAGKTTLLNIIATVLLASKGSIDYNKKNIKSIQDEYRLIIGYLPQKMDFYNHFTGSDFLQYMYVLKGGKEKKPKQLDELLKRLHLYDVRNNRIGTYSGGMKQRLGIAQAFIGSPKLLLLDEPTVGLDLEERAEFKKMIRQAGKEAIVLLSTHIVSDVEETADYVLFMHEGKIIEGNSRSYYEERMDKNEMSGLEEYYLKLAGRVLYESND
jgi:ABC-2 type transport system ATP-binding protein